MGDVGLDSILIHDLKIIPTSGGNVMHVMKSSDDVFHEFGEAYFSWIEPGRVKAWKRHKIMTMNLAVPVGSVKFVFFTSPVNFREVIIGENFYKLITVPPGIWYGFSGHSRNSSLILNLADTMHNPDEVERKDCATVDFKW